MLLRFPIFVLLVGPLSSCATGESPVEVICQIEACGNGPVVAATPTVVQIAASGGSSGALNGDLISAHYDSTSQVFAITASGLNAQMAPFAIADFGAMKAMRADAGLHNAYLGQGVGSRVVVYSSGTAGNTQELVGYGRIGATELPLVGTAEFNGHYAGFTKSRRINGDVTLDVDFQNALIGGRITDRLFRERPDNAAHMVNPLSDVILEQTRLGDDGTFSGITGGGQIVNGQDLWNPATGEFVGLIGGASANEAVGTVRLNHRAPNGTTIDEIGGFLATR